jgi:hypothetical protein
MEEATTRSWHFTQLRWALQALAIPAQEQVRLFPDWVAKVDELALDLEHWSKVVCANYAQELSQEQSARLADVNQKLGAMSRGGAEFEPELWTEEALSSSPHWTHARQLAADALASFGWPVERPPRDPRDRKSTFVR